MNFEIAMDMQKIATGDKKTLTRGQIAEEVLDLDNRTKGLKPEIKEKCRVYYEELVSNDEEKVYDIDMLTEEIASLKNEFSEFIQMNKADDVFVSISESIEKFFQIPQFEGLDSVEYGIHEVCVFSILEYFVWKTAPSHDHEKCRAEYRDDIARRTYDEVADKWIKVYDDLQKRYDEITKGIDEPDDIRRNITACAVLAISAIRDQDDFALDMAQGAAGDRSELIMDSHRDGTYASGESAMNDNIVKLLGFVYANIERYIVK